MKVFAYTKMPLTRVGMFIEPTNIPFSYAVADLAEVMRQEQRRETDLGKVILHSRTEKGHINAEITEQLWYQILSEQRTAEVLFVNWYKVQDIRFILKNCDQMKLEFKNVLNFLIPYMELLRRANYMADKADGPNCQPRNEIISDIRSRNDSIQRKVEEVRSLTKVIDINCLCTDEALNQKIVEIVQG